MGKSISVVTDSTVEFETVFRDTDGAVTDPTTVTLDVYPRGDPGSPVVTETKSGLTNPSAGKYTHRYKFTTAGTYLYEWFGETAASNSSERDFGVVTVSDAV